MITNIKSVIPQNSFCDGRLTLTTGTAVTTSDVTGAGTIYFTPYLGNFISLFDGANWNAYTFSEVSASLTLTSGKNYDVFIWNNAGTISVQISTAWTNDSARANALVLQNGIYVNGSAEGSMGIKLGRYVGTIRASGTNVTEDSDANRLVWNYYNRLPRRLRVIDTTDSWTYTTATWRQARASTANQVSLIAGFTESYLDLWLMAQTSNTSASTQTEAGIDEDGTTANDAEQRFRFDAITGGGGFVNIAHMSRFVTIGYHFYAWTEFSAAVGTTTWFGDNASADIQSGLAGWLAN